MYSKFDGYGKSKCKSDSVYELPIAYSVTVLAFKCITKGGNDNKCTSLNDLKQKAMQYAKVVVCKMYYD